MFAAISSACLNGLDGYPVSVEVHASNGLPGFTIVGLPDTACRESRDRVRAAMLSSGLRWPLRRVTVNLAPSTIRKVGTALDLPIAVGVLVATGELSEDQVAGYSFFGELGLDGTVRPVHGSLSLAAATPVGGVVAPVQCLNEVALIAGKTALGCHSLAHLVSCLKRDAEWAVAAPPERPEAPLVPDLADVRGQILGRLALEVAAAGGHHLLMVGPPGSGKTMLARRLPGLLPKLRPEDALETTKIHSAAGLRPRGGLIDTPPFRAPHHGASFVSITGGGTSSMRPGEVSLATNGVLFMDEMGEFPPAVLDSLRQPLEEGVIRISRARASATYPARFLLCAAMNPCPCGEGPNGDCCCSDAGRARYRRRVSGPLLDRLDLRIAVSRPHVEEMLGRSTSTECTKSVAARVSCAREVASSRGVRFNSEIPTGRLDELAPVSQPARVILESQYRSGELTARGLERVRRVARTVADLQGDEGPLREEAICVALELRSASQLLGASR